MSICKPYENTGVMDCRWLFGTLSRMILVPRYDASNDLNSLATEAAVTKAALQAKFTADQKADRFFPLPKVDNVNDERGEPLYIDFDSGATEWHMDGKRSVVAFIPTKEGAAPALLGKLNSFTEKDFGFFAIDQDGNFGYNLDDEGTIVLPFYIDGSTFRARWMPKRYGDQASGIELKFTLDDDVDDKNIRMIKKSSLDFDGRNKSDVFALNDATLTEVSNSLSELVITAATDYNIPITGMDAITDWYLYNTTDSAAINILTVVETSGTPGEYTFTFAAATEADAYSINLVASESKFDPEDTLTGTLTGA